MKVKFDLKYRQQIESGEYKVETVDGRQVRIVCWDAHNPYRENDIVALATSSSGEGENILRYYSNGHLISDSANVGNKDLMVIIPDDDERIRKKLIEYFNHYKEDREWWEGITPGDIISYLEKQKPSKWSEGDETCLQDALWCIEKAEEVAKGENDMGICWCTRRWLKFLPERFNLQSKQEWSEDKYPKNIETDAVMFCFDKGFNITPYQAKMIAKHYYELGFKRIGDGKA